MRTEPKVSDVICPFCHRKGVSKREESYSTIKHGRNGVNLSFDSNLPMDREIEVKHVVYTHDCKQFLRTGHNGWTHQWLAEPESNLEKKS